MISHSPTVELNLLPCQKGFSWLRVVSSLSTRPTATTTHSNICFIISNSLGLRRWLLLFFFSTLLPAGKREKLIAGDKDAATKRKMEPAEKNDYVSRANEMKRFPQSALSPTLPPHSSCGRFTFKRKCEHKKSREYLNSKMKSTFVSWQRQQRENLWFSIKKRLSSFNKSGRRRRKH